MAAKPEDRLLPPEIWSEILNRLPAKSILRSRSVCKSWYSLVSCLNFISNYTTRNLNKNGNRLLLQLYDTIAHVSSFRSHDKSFVESREHNDFPEAFLGSQVKIVGYCNGLICLSKYQCVDDISIIKFAIWNPAIRKVVELPSRTINSNSGRFSYHGFGFDFKTGDYKVMCTRLFYSRRKNRDCSDKDAKLCEVFDLRKGVWRGISPLMHPWDVRDGASECYLNGAVHWTGFRDIECSYRILLSFDMSDEIFREIRMPDYVKFVCNGDHDNHVTTLSGAFRGLIHVIMWAWEWNYDSNDMGGGFSVWVMKEYGVTESWTKLFNIDLQMGKVYQHIGPYEFCLWENGQVLMVLDLPRDEYTGLGDGQELILYNPQSRIYQQLFSSSKFIVLDMCLYEESLVLM